jgi:hypothetical protein
MSAANASRSPAASSAEEAAKDPRKLEKYTASSKEFGIKREGVRLHDMDETKLNHEKDEQLRRKGEKMIWK